MSDLDVVVIGAGAAGIAAGRTLADGGARFVVIEARDRVGGRAHTLTGRSGAAIDLGCGWLHSADVNPWTKIAEAAGFAIDRSDAPWTRPRLDVNFPISEQRAYQAAFSAFEDELDRAAREGPDRSAAELFDETTARWRPMLDAFSGWYNGAPFTDISVKDYAAYQPTDENWRVKAGYGALIAAHAAGLPVRLGEPVTRIAHGGDGVAVETVRESLKARAAIVCAPTTVLAHGDIAFDPPLPGKIEAAWALPLGHVDKAFLKLLRPEAFPDELMAFGRTDTADTGAYSFRFLGHPIVEGFFGGALADGLEREGSGAFSAFAMDELTSLLGSDFRRQAQPLAESRWGVDPFSRGAYSHARPGHADARARLAEPVAGKLFFAGEACSPHAFSTAHGAYETGVAAADAVLERLGLQAATRREPNSADG